MLMHARDCSKDQTQGWRWKRRITNDEMEIWAISQIINVFFIIGDGGTWVCQTYLKIILLYL